MAVTRRTQVRRAADQHDESGKNDSDIDQGDNTATGGDATATGGNGGNADTGNNQEFNGNARCAPRHPAAASATNAWSTAGHGPPFGGDDNEVRGRRRRHIRPTAATPTEATAATQGHWRRRRAVPKTIPIVKRHRYECQDDGCGCDSKNHKFDGEAEPARGESSSRTTPTSTRATTRPPAATPRPMAVTAATPIPATSRSSTATPRHSAEGRGIGLVDWKNSVRGGGSRLKPKAATLQPRAATPTEATAATPRHMAATAMPRTMPL